MLEKQRSLRIPIGNSDEVVEVYPDEMPQDVNSLLDVLRAEYAPLKVWRQAAVEYYRQQQLQNFQEVLEEVVSAMDPEVEDFYRKRGEYEEGIVEIFDALAAFSLYQSYSLVEDQQNNSESSKKLEALKMDIVANIKKSENVNRMNEYTWMIRGFYELSYGDIEHADYYLRSVYDRATKQKIDKRTFLYGSTLGLGAVAFAKKKYNAALDYFVKAMQSNPGKCGTNVRMAVATCCFKLKQFERARLAVDRVLSLDPCNIDALVMLSLLQRVQAGKVDAKRRGSYYRVARELCSLVTQLDPSSAVALNQMANYKFCDWKKLNVPVQVISPSTVKIHHTDDGVDYSFIKSLQAEDMFCLKRGLSAFVVQKISTFADETGQTVTNIEVKPESEIPLEWTGKNATLVSLVLREDLNQVSRIAASALRGSAISEVRAESYYILGRVYHLLSQFDNAMKFYEEALNLMPEMSLAAFGMGQLYLAKEQFDMSYQKFNEVLTRYPDDKDTQAYILFICSYHRKEIASIEKLKEIAPGFVFEADLWLSQGHAMHRKGPGEYSKALTCYEKAFEVMQNQCLVPHNHVLLNMGVLYHAAGNMQKALHFTRLSLEASDCNFDDGQSTQENPVFSEAENDVFFKWSEKVGLVEAILPEDNLTVNQRGTQNVLKLLEGDSSILRPGDEILVDNVVLKIENINSSVLSCRGMVCLYSSGSLGEKVFEVRKKLPRQNFNSDTIAHCYNFARIHEEIGQTQAASEVYLALLKQHPSFLECYLRLSIMASKLGRKKESQKWMERAVALDQSNVDATIAFGDLYMHAEDWDKALRKYEKICKERHRDPRSYVSLGNLHFASFPADGSLNESMKFFHNVLKDDPRNYYAANGLGMVCAMEGKAEAARDIFSRVREVKVSPPSNDAVTNLGHLYLQQRRYVDAIRIYKNVLKDISSSTLSAHGCHSLSQRRRQPGEEPGLRDMSMASYVATSDCLALSHLKHKQHDDAIRVLLKSLHLDPSQAHVWFNLAYTKEECAVASLMKTHKTTGEIENAISEIKSATSLFEAFSDEDYCKGFVKHSSFDAHRAQKHFEFCKDNLEKFQFHLQKAQEEEEQRESNRLAQLEEKASRAKAKEELRLKQLEEQARLNAARLEKAKQKQQILEDSWKATVESNASQNREKRKRKSKKDKAEGDAGSDVDVDDGDGGNANIKADQEMPIFDSDDEQNEVANPNSNALAAAESKAVFGSDSSDDEEEFNVGDASQKGGVKRSIESSDDEVEPNGSEHRAHQRRKVVDEDDD